MHNYVEEEMNHWIYYLLQAVSAGERMPMTIQEMSDQIQLLLNVDKSECGFCSMHLKEAQGIMLDHCGHIFCRFLYNLNNCNCSSHILEED